jgi:hypothetical protein
MMESGMLFGDVLCKMLIGFRKNLTRFLTYIFAMVITGQLQLLMLVRNIETDTSAKETLIMGRNNLIFP